MINNIEYKLLNSNSVRLVITFSDGTQNTFVLDKDDVNSFVFKLDAVFNDLLEMENSHASGSR